MAEQPVVPGRRGSAALVVLVLLAVGAVAALPWVANWWDNWTTSLRREVAATPSGEASRPVDQPADGVVAGAVLVVATDAAGQGASFALITVGAGDPTVVLLPPTMFEILPGFGDFQLADAPRFEDVAFASLVIENALGVRIDAHVGATSDDFGEIVGRDLVVDLRDDVLLPSHGVLDDLAAAGPLVRAQDHLGSLLVDQGNANALGWLDRQASIWDAVIGAMAGDHGIAERLANRSSDPGLARPVLDAAAGRARVALVPVARTGGDADEGFVLDAAEASSFVTERLGSIQVSNGERPRVEVLNGIGVTQVGRPIVQALVRNGFHVVRTDNAPNFGFERTLIVAQGNDQTPSAERIVALLGLGELQVDVAAPSNVVDVSIIVGQDAPSAEG